MCTCPRAPAYPQKITYISAKEPYTPAKEPHTPAKESKRASNDP